MFPRLFLAVLAVSCLGAGQLDKFNSLHPVEHCRQKSWLVWQGATFRNNGYPRPIRNARQEHIPDWRNGLWMPPKHGTAPATDSRYFEAWAQGELSVIAPPTSGKDDTRPGSYIFGWEAFEGDMRAELQRLHETGWNTASDIIATKFAEDGKLPGPVLGRIKAEYMSACLKQIPDPVNVGGELHV